MLDTVTGNITVISRFHHFQINERYDFFSFFKTLFYTKSTVSFTMVIKRYPGGESAGGGLFNFEIHMCSSGMNSHCIWRSISIQYVQIEPGVNSDLGNGSFWVEIRDAKHVDRSTHK